jgi:hypothetical protein
MRVDRSAPGRPATLSDDGRLGRLEGRVDPMPTYRVYRRDRRGNFRTGDWLKARDDGQAVAQAEELCDEETPTVEVWEATRMVDEIDCEDVPGDRPR